MCTDARNPTLNSFVQEGGQLPSARQLWRFSITLALIPPPRLLRERTRFLLFPKIASPEEWSLGELKQEKIPEFNHGGATPAFFFPCPPPPFRFPALVAVAAFGDASLRFASNLLCRDFTAGFKKFPEILRSQTNILKSQENLPYETYSINQIETYPINCNETYPINKLTKII